jgi:RNA polymerase sigma factor (sigma-70 family)
VNQTSQMTAEDEDLIRVLYPSLRRLAGVVGSPAMEPDDLVQEALVRAFRTVRLLDLEDPAAYLRRTVVNLASSGWRRRARERRAVRRLTAEISHTNPAIYPSDIADLLQVGPQARAVLYLHDIEGLGFTEVARMTDMTEGAARMLASRSRRRLRRLLESEAVQ